MKLFLAFSPVRSGQWVRFSHRSPNSTNSPELLSLCYKRTAVICLFVCCFFPRKLHLNAKDLADVPPPERSRPAAFGWIPPLYHNPVLSLKQHPLTH